MGLAWVRASCGRKSGMVDLDVIFESRSTGERAGLADSIGDRAAPTVTICARAIPLVRDAENERPGEMPLPAARDGIAVAGASCGAGNDTGSTRGATFRSGGPWEAVEVLVAVWERSDSA
jgi:hypothetical protein